MIHHHYYAYILAVACVLLSSVVNRNPAPSEGASAVEPVSLLQLRARVELEDGSVTIALRQAPVNESVVSGAPDDPCPQEPLDLNASCTLECPYTQLLAGSPCKKLCVQPQMCVDTHPARVFGDSETLECEPSCGADLEDRIIGCTECAGRGVCARCASFFELTKDGKCRASWQRPVNIMYCTVATGFVMILSLVAWIHTREPVNASAVEAGLEVRGHQIPMTPSGEMLPLWTTSMRHNQDISGIGATLYFRALVFMGVIVLLVLCVERTAPSSQVGAIEACNIMNPKESVEGGGPDNVYATAMAVALGGAYFVVMAVLYNFTSHQRVGHHTSMAAFALEVTELPESTDETMLEDPAVWGSQPGDLVGVSMAYDYVDHMWEVQASTMVFPDEPAMPMWWEAGYDESNPKQDQASCLRLFHCLHRSGSAIVVFRTTEAAKAAIQHGASVRGKAYPVRRIPAEPEGVRWHEFQREKPPLSAYAKGFAILFLVIISWSALYVPYAVTYMRTSRIPGLRVSPIMDLVLGVLIAIGNLMVNLAVEGAVDLVQLRYKPIRDVCVLYMCICFLLLNTACDVAMTVVLAQGINLDDAFSKPVGPHAGYSRVLARELLALIMPGYLIVPYLVEPIFTIALPKYLGTIVARADERVKPPLATAWLHCVPIELSWRYADIVNNLSLCWILLFMSSPRGWEACLYYICFLFLIGTVDRCTLLRIARSWHTSRFLHQAFCFLLILPTGILGIAAVFWLREAYPFLEKQERCHVYAVAGLFHLFLFVTMHRRAHAGDPYVGGETYEQVFQRHLSHGRPGTYFNLNPIYELKKRAGLQQYDPRVGLSS